MIGSAPSGRPIPPSSTQAPSLGAFSAIFRLLANTGEKCEGVVVRDNAIIRRRSPRYQSLKLPTGRWTRTSEADRPAFSIAIDGKNAGDGAPAFAACPDALQTDYMNFLGHHPGPKLLEAAKKTGAISTARTVAHPFPLGKRHLRTTYRVKECLGVRFYPVQWPPPGFQFFHLPAFFNLRSRFPADLAIAGDESELESSTVIAGGTVIANLPQAARKSRRPSSTGFLVSSSIWQALCCFSK
jgi:hypothetical protein